MNTEKLKEIIEGLRHEVEFERVEAAKWMRRYDERIENIKFVDRENDKLEKENAKLRNDVLYWKGEAEALQKLVEALCPQTEDEPAKNAAPQTEDAELPRDVCMACVHQVCAFPERDREDHKRGYPTTGFLQCGLNRMFKPGGKCPDFSRRPEGFNRKTIYV